MENERKGLLYDILIMLCVYLIACSLPLKWIFESETTVNIVKVILKYFAFGFIVFEIKSKKIMFSSDKKVSIIKYLPFVLICLGNIAVAFISGFNYLTNDNIGGLITLALFDCVATALCEEFLFRYLLLNFIRQTKKTFVSIILSACFFGLMHLVNISSLSSIPYVLLQCLYTFGLGIILGFVYLDSRKIYLPIILHALFNFLNDSLVSILFDFEYNVWFFVINMAITVLAGLYFIFMYMRSDMYVSNTMGNN